MVEDCSKLSVVEQVPVRSDPPAFQATIAAETVQQRRVLPTPLPMRENGFWKKRVLWACRPARAAPDLPRRTEWWQACSRPATGRPDLTAPLARLIGAAAGRAQVVVVGHAPVLADALDALPEARRFMLKKRLGKTAMEGEQALEWK